MAAVDSDTSSNANELSRSPNCYARRAGPAIDSIGVVEPGRVGAGRAEASCKSQALVGVGSLPGRDRVRGGGQRTLAPHRFHHGVDR